MSKYQNRHIQNIFNVSAPTVRNWATDFADYLSPSANPPANKTRYFTDDDLRVLATVARLRDEKRNTDEIIEQLNTGILDEPPIEVPIELIDITASDVGLKLIREIEQMRIDIENLKSGDAEKQNLVDEIARLNRLVGRLEARLEIEQEKNKSKDDSHIGDS